MTQINLKVRFEVQNNDLAFAYVNDAYVGRVKRRGDKIVFRCSSNPFTNKVPGFIACPELTFSDLFAPDNTTPIHIEWHAKLLLRGLVPIVVRNYLRNFAFPEISYL